MEKLYKPGTRYTTEKGKLKEIPELAELLIEEEPLNYLRMCPGPGLIYIYDEDHYRLISENKLENIIFKKLNSQGVRVSYIITGNLVSQLKLLKGMEQKETDRDSRYVSFKNGILDLLEDKFIPHNPKYFVTSCLDYDYNPNVGIKNFMEFLEHFSENNKTKMHFLRCWLKMLISNWAHEQVFLYILGRGCTGKSVFGNLACCLVG
jgi:putative DNA primase/helicase